MTQAEKHADFTTRLMPRLKRIARKRFRERRDRDDRTADLVARGWEAYVNSVHRGRPPSLRAVLRGADEPRRKSHDLLDRSRIRVRSLAEPSIRHVVSQIPA